MNRFDIALKKPLPPPPDKFVLATRYERSNGEVIDFSKLIGNLDEKITVCLCISPDPIFMIGAENKYFTLADRGFVRLPKGQSRIMVYDLDERDKFSQVIPKAITEFMKTQKISQVTILIIDPLSAEGSTSSKRVLQFGIVLTSPYEKEGEI